MIKSAKALINRMKDLAMKEQITYKSEKIEECNGETHITRITKTGSAAKKEADRMISQFEADAKHFEEGFERHNR